MEAVFVVQIGQQGHCSNRVRCVHDYEIGLPLSSCPVVEVPQFLAGCQPVGQGKQGQIP